MAYHSKRIKAAPGTEIVTPLHAVSTAEHVRQVVLDIAALPFVAALPPHSVAIGGVALEIRGDRLPPLELAKRASSRDQSRSPGDV